MEEVGTFEGPSDKSEWSQFLVDILITGFHATLLINARGTRGTVVYLPWVVITRTFYIWIGEMGNRSDIWQKFAINVMESLSPSNSRIRKLNYEKINEMWKG